MLGYFGVSLFLSFNYLVHILAIMQWYSLMYSNTVVTALLQNVNQIVLSSFCKIASTC